MNVWASPWESQSTTLPADELVPAEQTPGTFQRDLTGVVEDAVWGNDLVNDVLEDPWSKGSHVGEDRSHGDVVAADEVLVTSGAPISGENENEAFAWATLELDTETKEVVGSITPQLHGRPRKLSDDAPESSPSIRSHWEPKSPDTPRTSLDEDVCNDDHKTPEGISGIVIPDVTAAATDSSIIDKNDGNTLVSVQTSNQGVINGEGGTPSDPLMPAVFVGQESWIFAPLKPSSENLIAVDGTDLVKHSSEHEKGSQSNAAISPTYQEDSGITEHMVEDDFGDFEFTTGDGTAAQGHLKLPEEDIALTSRDPQVEQNEASLDTLLPVTSALSSIAGNAVKPELRDNFPATVTRNQAVADFIQEFLSQPQLQSSEPSNTNHASPPGSRPTFEVDLTSISTLFTSPADQELLPDANTDIISSTSERKTWYRISRRGTVKEHNSTDLDNYVRVTWPKSAIKAKVVDIVGHWIHEDRMNGGTAMFGGDMSRPGFRFNWNEPAPPGRVTEPLHIASSNVLVPHDQVLKNNFSWTSRSLSSHPNHNGGTLPSASPKPRISLVDFSVPPSKQPIVPAVPSVQADQSNQSPVSLATQSPQPQSLATSKDTQTSDDPWGSFQHFDNANPSPSNMHSSFTDQTELFHIGQITNRPLPETQDAPSSFAASHVATLEAAADHAVVNSVIEGLPDLTYMLR